MTLAYDGKAFDGFQSQPSGNGVQDHVERALRIFFREPTPIRGASRTDRGVHAQGQVATFSTAHPFLKHRWLRGWNAILPPGIGVLDVGPAESGFHPIWGAKAKAYRYRLWLGDCYNPLIKPYVWEMFRPVDVELLKREMQSFLGLHDFTSFCATDSDAKTKERRVLDIQVCGTGPLLDLWFLGEGFLKQMIRIMVGSAVNIASGQDNRTVKDMLSARSRIQGGPTAPAHGLSLVEVFYESPPSLEAVLHKQKQGYSLASFL